MTAKGVETIAITELKPYGRNPRTHSKLQIRQIARSIERFGFTNPVLISDDHEIIAGHGRVEAAKLLGHLSVPAIKLSHLGPAERRAYVLADNKLPQAAGWDRKLLAVELQNLVDLDFEVELTGFSLAEVALVLDDTPHTRLIGRAKAQDVVPPLAPRESAVTQRADVWLLGRHRLLCGDPGERAAIETLMQGEPAHLIFTDPLCSLELCGPLDAATIDNGADAANEPNETADMLTQALIRLKAGLGHAAAATHGGAIAFVCMNWRYMAELLSIGRQVFGSLKDLCVWTNAPNRAGLLYRSEHELVFVFEVSAASPTPWCRPAGPGGRRTNVWDYAAPDAVAAGRVGEFGMTRATMNVSLVADAIGDCSRPGEIVLDPFGGLGATLIAAETTGRSARLIEPNPAACDLIVKRYQGFTGTAAVLGRNRASFERMLEQRAQPLSATSPMEIGHEH